jgi:hypothetical protein
VGARARVSPRVSVGTLRVLVVGRRLLVFLRPTTERSTDGRFRDRLRRTRQFSAGASGNAAYPTIGDGTATTSSDGAATTPTPGAKSGCGCDRGWRSRRNYRRRARPWSRRGHWRSNWRHDRRCRRCGSAGATRRILLVARRLLLPLSKWCVVAANGSELLRLLSRSIRGTKQGFRCIDPRRA